jgi:uncharacterized pyridoxal phosphate-dependent enzyme
MKTNSTTKDRPVSRRELFRKSGIAATAGVIGTEPAGAAPARRREPPPDVYTRLGVRPFINCTATYTINGGSRLLPEVIEAIEQASHYHVNLDELMEAAGRRISQLLRVPWAMVSSGAAAALSHATAACVAGADPERMKQLPDTSGLKNEVILPRSSRNEYFHAVRATGVRFVEVNSADEMRAAISSRTAMALVLGNRFEDVILPLKEVAGIAHKAGIPVLVDAAADYLIVPNPYLADGADLVAYSGGKILRGPQTAGLLLGREDLVRAAYANSSPHHAFGRMMKVSKEEIVGMVTAVESWVNRRNREAEYKEWESWYAHITNRLKPIEGVSTRVLPPSRGGPFPILEIDWNPEKIGLTAGELNELLLKGDPAILTHAEGEGHSFVLRPVAMKPDDYRVVAERLSEVFRHAPPTTPRTPESATRDISGRWDVRIEYLRGEARHTLDLEARGNEVAGKHTGIRLKGGVSGAVHGDHVRLRSVLPYEESQLVYVFEGTLAGDRMEGELSLGEFPKARWSAARVS